MIPESAKERYKDAYGYARTGEKECWGGDYPYHKQSMNDLYGMKIADAAIKSLHTRHAVDSTLLVSFRRFERLPF